MKSDITVSMVDKTATTVGSGSTYGGMAAALYGWVTSSDGAILLGLVFTIGGFIVNYIFARRREKRESEEHEWRRQEHLARMKAIADRTDEPNA